MNPRVKIPKNLNESFKVNNFACVYSFVWSFFVCICPEVLYLLVDL